MVLIPNAQESSVFNVPDLPKFWPDGFMSEVVTLDNQTGVWLCLLSSFPKLKFIPEDTINRELEALDAQNLRILFCGIDYVKME
jgi:hypothetical protein